MSSPAAVTRSTVLLICAAGHGVTIGGVPAPVVCGRPPGHYPATKHRDVEWAVEWDEPAVTRA